MKTTAITMRETKAGAPYKVFTMEDGKRLSVFQFDSRYEAMEVGVDIDDEQLVYDQQYDNYKLKPLPKPAGSPRGGFAGKQAEVLMDKKAGQIEASQARKNDAIARAGAFRDATLVSLQMLKDQPFPTDEDFKSTWRAWVKFFLNEAEQPFI